MRADPNRRMVEVTGSHPYGIEWGICRGNPLHLYCANEEAGMLTWMGFFGWDDPHKRGEGKTCVGCGGPVNEEPRPGFDPICPGFA